MEAEQAAAVFDGYRAYLLGVAYRLTSSWADAEDAVADAWPRWAQHAATVEEPRGWLTRVVARIALDQLRSARARRETYVGPWLPEPLVTPVDSAGSGGDPAEGVVWNESVRIAFLVVLDQLSPEQRLAVVLHDVVGLDFAEVADVIGCSVATARQHASRGRRRLETADVPPRTPPGEFWLVLGELSAALQSGDATRLAALLAPDVVLTGDGGGQVSAARRPLVGSEEVGRFLQGLASRFGEHAQLQLALVNGDPGFVVRVDSDRPQDANVAVYTFSVRAGRVEAVYGILAPDKTARVPAPHELEQPGVPGFTLAPARSDPAEPHSAAPSGRTPGRTPRRS